ncbi:hypothetical protein M885DRAFT_623583 [Pelagophyceae sp. CCMP2097]|nr:hypothetical protein M885DRAFT_623583 [Pelagophyceae sp. CCMP2097]
MALLLLCLAGAVSALSPSASAPLLDSPAYSLATLNEDGTTNMNMVTYASPVGIRPHRLWMVSLYKKTQSHANFARSGRGVLALLGEDHADLTHALGGTSGGDKAAACAALGHAWTDSPHFAEQALPRCTAYVELEKDPSCAPWDAGDHEVFACRVANFFEDGAARALSTARGV